MTSPVKHAYSHNDFYLSPKTSCTHMRFTGNPLPHLRPFDPVILPSILLKGKHTQLTLNAVILLGFVKKQQHCNHPVNMNFRPAYEFLSFKIMKQN